MRMLRGRFQMKLPRAAAADFEERTTAAVGSSTLCPFLCCCVRLRSSRPFSGHRRKAASQPPHGVFQGGVVIRQELIPAGCCGSWQSTHHNSESGTVLAQRDSASFSKSPLNEVPGNSVPDSLGNDEADAAWLIGSDRCRI